MSSSDKKSHPKATEHRDDYGGSWEHGDARPGAREMLPARPQVIRPYVRTRSEYRDEERERLSNPHGPIRQLSKKDMPHNPNPDAHAPPNFSRPRPHAHPTYSLFPQERVSQREAQFRADMMALQARQTVNLRAKLRAVPQTPPVQPQYIGPKKLQRRTGEKEKEVGCCILM
ncbi:hypothetical protein P171DRAFT_469807 [Karstenula rhodostoma CBS 690.94]|uniref:Uncharacterized protein n=1 Tax=Karstenula rhodostoma CBS 690.94 TaxID=1392251 RepID=A0A9P4PTI0_9PLEO|nr:hypothetical protein P171DRAFT_469807 [Karstenula rhodostoma CBS 690.94]